MAATEEDCAQSEPSEADVHRGRPTPPASRAGLGGGPIRRARPGDLAELLRLEATFPGDRLSRRQLIRHLHAPTAEIWVLGRADGGLAGYLLLLWHQRRRDGRIYSLVVDPDRRGLGLGQALLAHAMERARVRGAAGLRLEVRPDNLAALALYARNGFSDIGARAAYYQDGASARCMRWEPARAHPDA